MTKIIMEKNHKISLIIFIVIAAIFLALFIAIGVIVAAKINAVTGIALFAICCGLLIIVVLKIYKPDESDSTTTGSDFEDFC